MFGPGFIHGGQISETLNSFLYSIVLSFCFCSLVANKFLYNACSMIYKIPLVRVFPQSSVKSIVLLNRLNDMDVVHSILYKSHEKILWLVLHVSMNNYPHAFSNQSCCLLYHNLPLCLHLKIIHFLCKKVKIFRNFQGFFSLVQMSFDNVHLHHIFQSHVNVLALDNQHFYPRHIVDIFVLNLSSTCPASLLPQ